jgi:NAD(P)-dependent dehydrogenase (short-subunit alcohol dehydrogenase family)
MIERRSGVIINLTSHRLAQRGAAGQAAYAAAKAAVERLTESLAEELKEYGIAANILHPG